MPSGPPKPSTKVTRTSTNEALRVKEHEARTACQKLRRDAERSGDHLIEWGMRPAYAELPKVDPLNVPEGTMPQRLLEEKVKKAEAQFGKLKIADLPKLLKSISSFPLPSC